MEPSTRNIRIPDHIIETWQKVVNVVADIFEVPSVMINRLDPPDLEIFRSNISAENPFPSGIKMPMMGVYCAAAVERQEMVQVSDARLDAEWKDSPTAQAGIYAYLGFPVCWPNGDAFGTICAVDVKAHEWGKRYESLLLTFKDALEAHLVSIEMMQEVERKNNELNKALQEVKTLQGLLPICSSCKKIRDDKGYWNQLEGYFCKHSELQFSHGICPDCARKYYSDYYNEE